MFRNVAELVELAESQGKKIADVMIDQEVEVTGRLREEILEQMDKNLTVMEQAVERGLAGVSSHSGLTGGDAVFMQKYIEKGSFLSGKPILEGGCQAEVGSASGMAAAAIVELAGGTPSQAAEAMAITLKNMLGLVCDPVAGLVEVPCVKRNAMGAANAMVAADMALAGITSRIPCDEVIDAMFRIGQSMPTALKETAQGGLAATPTGRELEAKIFGISLTKSEE